MGGRRADWDKVGDPAEGEAWGQENCCTQHRYLSQGPPEVHLDQGRQTRRHEDSQAGHGRVRTGSEPDFDRVVLRTKEANYSDLLPTPHGSLPGDRAAGRRYQNQPPVAQRAEDHGED